MGDEPNLRVLLPRFNDRCTNELVTHLVDVIFNDAKEEEGTNLTAMMAAGAVVATPALRIARPDLIALFNAVLDANAVDFKLVPKQVH